MRDIDAVPENPSNQKKIFLIPAISSLDSLRASRSSTLNSPNSLSRFDANSLN